MPIDRLKYLLIFLWAAAGSLPTAGLAQEAETEGEPANRVEQAPRERTAMDEIESPFSLLHPEALEETPRETAESPVAPTIDPCEWDLSDPLQEDARELVRGTTCYTFRWFDSLFGDEVDYPEEQVNGLVTVGGAYRQYDGFDSRFRFRVRAPLPNLDNRWNIFLGRGDDDALISDTDTQDPTFYNPGIANRDEEDSLLLGLGRGRRGGHRGWDWSVGVRLRTPPVPYVKTHWFYYKAFSDNADFRFRQTFFWRDDDGFGTTTRGDYAWSIGPKDAIRVEAFATASEVTDGAEWYVGHTWYHLVNDRGAFSLRSFVNGETGAEVELNEFGFDFIWRQRFTRDWLYLSIGPSVTWPRYRAEEERELSLGFGAWLEMEFGQWVYR
ncbi:MAG: hypothetical protein P8008_00190 [Gammaproteobacteria bacterium]